MLSRLLLFTVMTAGTVAPLYAQDEDVTKYIEELRAPKPPRDESADMQTLLTVLNQEVDATTNSTQKASLYLRISDIEQAIGDPEAAIAAARNAVDLEPADEKTALGLATVLVQNGHTAEVPALLGIDPSDGAAVLGYAQHVGNTPVAAYFAELAHQLLPGDPKAADTLGQIYMRSGRPKQAAGLFGDAIGLAPQVATYHYHQALASMQSGDRDQAASELLLALESNPGETERANIENTIARLAAPLKH